MLWEMSVRGMSVGKKMKKETERKKNKENERERVGDRDRERGGGAHQHKCVAQQEVQAVGDSAVLLQCPPSPYR